MIGEITKEDVKEYFAKVRKIEYDRREAEALRLKKLETFRLAALNKNNKLFGKGLSLGSFRSMMKGGEQKESAGAATQAVGQAQSKVGLPNMKSLFSANLNIRDQDVLAKGKLP